MRGEYKTHLGTAAAAAAADDGQKRGSVSVSREGTVFNNSGQVSSISEEAVGSKGGKKTGRRSKEQICGSMKAQSSRPASDPEQ